MKLINRWLIDRWGQRRDDFDWRTFQTPLDLDSVGSVLILNLNGKLGDALMISLLVDALARARPELSISIGTTEEYVEYWRRHPAVRQVATFPTSHRARRSVFRRVREARRAARPFRGRFDLVVSLEPYAAPDHFALFRTLRARTNVGFNKHVYRLFTYSLEERRHGVAATSVAERTARVMEVFGREVDVRALRFSVPFDREDAEAASEALGPLPAGTSRLLLNTYGAGKEKVLEPHSVVRAVAEIRRTGYGGAIVASLPPGREATFLEALREAALDGNVTSIPPMADFFKLFALVSLVDVVVSPDTSVGHIAAAFGKPQVCLFARSGTIPAAWRPYSERCLCVVSTDGRNVNGVDWDAFGKAVCGALALAASPCPAR